MNNLFTRILSVFSVFLICSCADGGTTPLPTSDGGGLSADASDASKPDSGPTSSVPMIDEAFPLSDEGTFKESCPKGSAPTPGVGPGDALHRVTIDLKEFPNAVCNDGSKPVVYIRKSTGGENENKWLFHFQGGGGCSGEYTSCFDRWCGNDYYHAGKMSSRWSKESMNSGGIVNRNNKKNTLADGNIVFLHYCSSDGWGRQVSDYVVTSSEDPTKSYRMHFRGRTIVEAVFAQLLSGSTTSDNGTETVPSIATANEVLITGSSAGSGGVLTNLDWISEKLGASANVKGVFDAAYLPLMEDITDEKVVEGFNMKFAAGLERYQANPDDTTKYRDESCMETLADDPRDCFHTNELRLNHVTTPFFIRADLADPKTVAPIFEARLLVEPNSPGTPKSPEILKSVAEWSRATALRFKDVMTTATEKDKYTITPGVYGNLCQQHIALTNDDWFFEATLKDKNGVEKSFHDALKDWLDGKAVEIVDTVPPTLSTCKVTTDQLD
jgi:hypothetical protein